MRQAKSKAATIEPLEQRMMLSVQQFVDLAPVGLNPRDLTSFNNELLFFRTSTQDSLLELWTSNGTAKGTRLLKDVGPDDSIEFSNNEHLTRSGDYVYFVEHDPEGIPELWETDGTADGTILLHQFDKGDEPLNLTDYNGELMFSVNETLWKSDGTPNGTMSIAQVTDPSVSPSSFITVGNWLYFDAGSGATAGLWRSDGTPQGTSLYAPLTSWSPEGSIGNNYYFSKVTNDVSELWRVDPTLGMIRVGSMPSGSTLFTDINGQAWFITQDPIPPTQSYGTQSIWWTDGTNLHRVYTSDSNVTLSNLTGVGSKVLFVTQSSSAQLLELDTAHNNSVQTLTSLGTIDHRYYQVNGFVTSIKVGTQAVYIVAPNLDEPSILNPFVYLYKSDGTPAGTTKFAKARINYEDDFFGSGYSLLPPPADVNGKFFFSALDDLGQFQLWSSDLTSAGTHMVYKPMAGVENYEFSNLLTIGDTLYFSTFVPGPAENDPPVWVWKTDGIHQPKLIQMFDYYEDKLPNLFAAGQTMMMAMSNDLFALNSKGNLVQISSDMENFTIFAQTPTRTYFTASQGSDVYLWTTDGTSKGTVRLYAKKLYANTVSQYFDPTQFQNRLYFILQPAGSKQRQLWSTDGTQLGTARVTNLAGMFANPSPADISAFGKKLCYVASDANAHEHLWITDGTKAGTLLLANIGANDMTQMESSLYFWVFNRFSAPVLYQADGTKKGTIRIATLPRKGDLKNFRAVGGRLSFEFDSDFNTSHPLYWISDGTSAGTVQTTWPQDAMASFLGTAIFLTDSTGIYRGDKGHSHLIATLPTDANPGAIAQLGDRYFFALSYSDQDSGDAKEGLWFYQQ